MSMYVYVVRGYGALAGAGNFAVTAMKSHAVEMALTYVKNGIIDKGIDPGDNRIELDDRPDGEGATTVRYTLGGIFATIERFEVE